MAKFTGTDAGVANGQMALDLMGQAGLRQDRIAEKHLRDAKLMQIYEGTNQLNCSNALLQKVSHRQTCSTINT